jgi:hypothetical protein
MACPCKKKIDRTIKYNRKLAVKSGEKITEETTDETEEYISFGKKILNVFKFFGLLLALISLICLIVPLIIIWFIYQMIKSVILRKETRINSPFYEYDKIKKRVKKNSERIRRYIESKKNKETNSVITI